MDDKLKDARDRRGVASMSRRMLLAPEARAWLSERRACQPGYRWAAFNCATLREVVASARPDWMRWVAARALPPSARAEWMARALDRVVSADVDPRTLAVAPALRRWAAGEIGDEEMARVADAADAAAFTAADAADAAFAIVADAAASTAAAADAGESEAQRRDALEILDASGWPDA